MGVHPGEGAPRPEALPERTSLRSRLNARLRAAALGFPEPSGRPGEVPAGRINITWSWSGTRIPGPQRTFPSRSPAAPAPPGDSGARWSSGATFEIFSFLASPSLEGLRRVKKPRPLRGHYPVPPYPGAQFQPGGLWVAV